MNIKTLTLLLFIFASTLLNAQVLRSPDLYYGRYEGNIDENIPVTANIMRAFGQVTGNYHVTPSDLNESESMYRKKVLSGQISGDSVSMKEFGRKSEVIEGSLSSTQMNGYWMLSANQPKAFSLEASYPIGSLPFEVSYLRSELNLAPEKADSPTASIELTLVYPENNNLNEGVFDSISHHINSGFFGEGVTPSHPDSLLLNYEREYYENYKKQNQQWLETGGHSFSWEKVISMNISYNSNHLLCLEFERYAYSGGAHGMSNIAYQLINLHDGSLLKFEDIFIHGSDSILTSLLTRQLKEDRSIPIDSTLKSGGFFVDSIVPNHNIFLEQSGIGFTYNPYEIAPYSFGSTTLFLNFNQLIGILKPSTPVFILANSLN